MKLKFLFFPFSLIVATVLSIWFIWPTWFDEKEGIIALGRQIDEKETEFNNVKLRKENLLSLQNNLEVQSANMNLTEKYYPESRNTETIINEINYFSSSAGTSISDVSVNVLGAKDRNIRGSQSSFACLPVVPAKKESPTAVSATSAGNVEPNAIEESQAVLVSMEIELLGGYENIKNFITRLSGMEMINNVHSVEISRSREQNIEGEEGEFVATGDLLESKVGVCFGYLPQSSVLPAGDFISHKVFGVKEFDFGYIDQMNSAIYRPASTIEIGETGKVNPFTP